MKTITGLVLILCVFLHSAVALSGTLFLNDKTAVNYIGDLLREDDRVLFRLPDRTLVCVNEKDVDWQKTTLTRDMKPPPAEKRKDRVLISKGKGEWQSFSNGDLDGIMAFLQADEDRAASVTNKGLIPLGPSSSISADDHLPPAAGTLPIKPGKTEGPGSREFVIPKNARLERIASGNVWEKGMVPERTDTIESSATTPGARGFPFALSEDDAKEILLLPDAEFLLDRTPSHPEKSQPEAKDLSRDQEAPEHEQDEITDDNAEKPTPFKELSQAVKQKYTFDAAGKNAPAPRFAAELLTENRNDTYHKGAQTAMLAPAQGTYVAGSTIIEVALSASLENNVESIAFYAEGRHLVTVRQPPFSISWRTPGRRGPREIKAVIKEKGGETVELKSRVKEIVSDESLLVNLIPLNVSVRTRDNLLVQDLDASDFVVFENGSPQSIHRFSHGSIPLSVMLLIDISFSMRGEKLRSAKAGAERFIETLNLGDRAGILAFDDRLYLKSRPSSDLPALKECTRNLRAGQGTSLFDAIKEGITLLDKELGRKAIIILSDGEDYHSKLKCRDVIEAARRSDVQIYAIGMYGSRMTNGTGERHWAQGYCRYRQMPEHWMDKLATRGIDFLRQLTSETGGMLYVPKFFDELPDVYNHILFELKNQYLLEYY
ncbi:VWA domain-containing protein, partial [Acidobacteriota bacterium]